MAITINEDNMSLQDYKNLYDAIVKMSFDIEGQDYSDRENIAKLTYVASIIGCINDVPKRYVEGYLESKKKKTSKTK